MATNFGETDRRTLAWQTQLNNAKVALADLEGELEDNNKALSSFGDATDDAGGDARDAAKDIGRLEDAADDLGDEMDSSGKKALSFGDVLKANLASEAIVAGVKAIGSAIKPVNQRHKINGRLANEVVWSPYGEPGDPQEQWHWRTMWSVEPGDTILHYSEQRIVAISTALTSAVASRNPFHDDDAWMQEGKQINVDIDRLENPIAKDEIPLRIRQNASQDHGPFQQNGDNVKQGYFFPVSEELWRAILEISGLKQGGNPVADEPDQFMFTGSSDVAAVVKARRDQTRLRKYLLDGRNAALCGICGRLTPARYLHAAHIKQRAAASEKERRKPGIAMLACVLGCDQAFECGDIRVDSNGRIYLPKDADEFTHELFGKLAGQLAPAFNDENRDYFAYREASFDRSL